MFNFNPPNGLLDINSFPSDPTSETEARQQFMTLFNQLKDYINNIIEQNITENSVPSGTISFFAMNKAPNGWLKCEGQSLNKLAYPLLFNAIGTTFGGDTINFKLPDLRGQFIRGIDNSKGIDSGRAFGSTQQDDFKSHIHSMNYVSYNGIGGSGFNYFTPMSGQSGVSNTDSVGGTETRPKNIALLACIKI